MLDESKIVYKALKSPKRGEQHVNTTNSGVRAIYLPLKIEAISFDEQSQHLMVKAIGVYQILIGSIADHYVGKPTIDTTFKNSDAANYWSSATYAGSATYAWVVSFEFGGNIYKPKSQSYHVRCVRSRK